MKKSELLNWFQEECQRWELLLAAIGQKRMTEVGVNGEWTMRDIIAHLTGWQSKLVNQFIAAMNGELEPPPPWSKELKSEDDINAWIYETNHKKDLGQVLEDARQVHEKMRNAINNLPDDIRIETIDSKFHVVYINDQRFAVGEFFHHFYDDHQADVYTWLSKSENK
ncbi:MAG: ClbS/DfsB family four-helix bundle protein [Anaerolineales bacterium]